MGTQNEQMRIAVPVTHQEICRFHSEDSSEFQTLFKQLKLLVTKAVRTRDVQMADGNPRTELVRYGE